MKEKILKDYETLGIMLAFLTENAINNKKNSRASLKLFLTKIYARYEEIQIELLRLLKTPEIALQHNEERD